MNQKDLTSARRRTILRAALLTGVTAMTAPHPISCARERSATFRAAADVAEPGGERQTAVRGAGCARKSAHELCKRS